MIGYLCDINGEDDILMNMDVKWSTILCQLGRLHSRVHNQFTQLLSRRRSKFYEYLFGDLFYLRHMLMIKILEIEKDRPYIDSFEDQIAFSIINLIGMDYIRESVNITKYEMIAPQIINSYPSKCISWNDWFSYLTSVNKVQL